MNEYSPQIRFHGMADDPKLVILGACANESENAMTGNAEITRLKAIVCEQGLEYQALDDQYSELSFEMDRLQTELAECRLNLKLARRAVDG